LDSALEEPSEEDPIIIAKRLSKKQPPRQTTSDQYHLNHTDLKPWDDKPDPCLRQSGKEIKKQRNFLKNGTLSQSKQQSVMESMEKSRIPKLIKSSVNSLGSTPSQQNKNSGSSK